MNAVRRLVGAIGLVCLIGATAVAEDPVAVTMTIRNGQLRGGFLHGEMDITVVNHLSSPLRNVRLSLERPSSGILGRDGVVEVGDIAVDATAAAVADFAVDPAFLESSDPYVIRVNLVDITDTEIETVVFSVRHDGGVQ